MRYLLAILLLLPVSAFAGDELVRTISVVGEAKESIVPDQATISVEAYAKDMELNTAKKQHDDRLKSILALAKKYNIEDKYLSTQSARIQPHYRWVSNTQTFEGYSVSTTVQFTLVDLNKVGTFLQDAVNVKAHTVNGPHYSIKEEKPIRDLVRVAAVADAKAKAEALADQLDMEVGKPVTISDRYQTSSQPIMKRNMVRAEGVMAMAAPVADSVAPPVGEQEVHAQVYITFEME